MATPAAAHARMAADPKTPDAEPEGLKNGTSLDDSDDSSGALLAKNRGPSGPAPPQHGREAPMDGFQDGGPNSRPASVEAAAYPAPVDRYPHFGAQGPREDEFRNSQEGYNEVGPYHRSGYGGDPQHGGSDITTNKMYPGYSQPRPGYAQGPRGPQQRSSGMGPYPGGNSQQQRFLSGPSLSQQTGPTPTLNQLLQAPNSMQRYHNNYEYSQKNMGDSGAPHYQGPNNSWGGSRGSSGYPPQQMSTAMYRSQGDSSMKRPYPSSPASAPPQQYPQQYHPYSQSPTQGGPPRPPNQSYPQQGTQQYSNVPQHGQTPSQMPAQMGSGSAYDHQRQPSMSSYPGSSVPSGPSLQQQQQLLPSQPQPTQQQHQTPPQQQPPPPQQPQPPQPAQQQQTPPSQQQPPPHASMSPQQQQLQPPPTASHPQPQPPAQDAAAGGEDAPDVAPALRNLTTPPHASPHRPAPSPSGSSTGSPSMSPALGQQSNIPMPPRPSSTQSENSGQAPIPQSPVAPQQAYNQPMAPPAMYGNKMHQNMMGSGAAPHMAPYSPPGHYQQSGYHRPTNSMSMHNYGNQAPNNYPGPNYPTQPHRMPSHPSPSNYPASNQSGYNNAQYSNTGPPPPSGYSMNNMMPPPNQYPKSTSMPPPSAGAGAQAAAQAAVIAAAASSGPARQSPMYLRQHLQQKMYNNYNSAPGSNGGQEAPMPPPASTPSSQPMNQSALTSLGNASSCDGPLPASMVPSGFTQASSLGMPPTTVTQSISSPVPSAVTVSSPSVSDVMQSQQVRTMGGPPPVMDEGSQASNASASSSLPEERVETPKPNNKPVMSHPPTPNTLPSPGAASMSSFHDEFESVSSPSWPRTPASPVINNQPYDHHPIKRPDGMLKLYDMSDDPDRRLFLDKLIMYQEERGTPLSQCPTISKQPLDLYRLYLAAKERGGFVEVMKGKMWKEIAGIVGIGASSSAAYTLRKQYIKHLLPFECKYDRGGIDPVPLISSLESNSRKKNAKNAGGPMMDGYPGHYPGGYPPNTGPHPGMMPSSEYPGPGGHHPYPEAMHHPGSSMVNHSDGVMDPFSDEMQGGSQYPARHNTADNFGYSQSNAGGNVPPYPGNQPNVPPSSFGYSNTSGQQEPYSDQYSNSMVPPPSSEPGYGGRNMVGDPYAPPPGGYPPNRTVGPSNSSQYPPYQNPCTDQESRFNEPPNAPPNSMIRPSTPVNSVIGSASQQDPSVYPQHRYSSSPMNRDSMPPQPMGYQGRPAMGPSQYPAPNPPVASPYSAAQPDSYRNPEFQNYPSSQQGMYSQSMPPPNKVAPPGNMYQRDMYSMGPKRHTDYSKTPHGPGQDQYHMGSYSNQPPQGPYPDRSQYGYRPTHSVPPQQSGSPQQGWPRDRSYPSGQSQYPPGARENWDMSRHSENASQPGGPPWSRYGPHPDSYPHPSMGPKMMARGYGPNKMPPHGGVGPPPQYPPPSLRKEVIFPPDAVEAVTPLITKRRRLLSKDVAPIDPWRIMMALKSGLLGESTWALDVLTILIHDDATVLYFGLNHLQGLLEVLMDHYRRCLNSIFDLVGDMEVGFMQHPCEPKHSEKKWYELDCDGADAPPPAISGEDSLSGDRTVILDSTNYTYRTRCRKSVRTQEEQALFLFDPDKKWDVHEGYISGSSHWQHGGGEYTGYIQTQFESSEKHVRFVRVLKDSVKSCKSSKNSSNGKLKSNEKHCKKECGSDTEEDEGPSVNSPKPSTQDSTTSKNEDNAKVANFSEDVNNSTKKLVSENGERTCDSEAHEPTPDAGSVDQNKPSNSENGFPKIRAISPTRKRRALEDLEDESYTRDEPSLCTVTDSQDSIARRCISASTILRNLSFVPGNDTEMSKHSGFLLVLGRLLLLHHVHSPRRPPQRHYDREEEGESSSVADSCSSLNSEHEWWWDMLHILRENTLVTLANISGQLDLAPFPEEISFPILDGLMHWVTCPSSYAQDPLPTQPSHSVLSPQRLSLEALSKLSVLESNVDLMMATPPWERIDRFFALLSKWLSRNEDQVLREFSVVLLSNLSQADSSMARAIALQGTCIPLLITFVEQAEQSALQVANSQGINALRENPELMGTTLDMVRRSAGTLRCLAKVPSNRTLFLQHQQRLLALVMSQILDQGVASIIADVLFECSGEEAEESSSVERVLPAEESAT